MNVFVRVSTKSHIPGSHVPAADWRIVVHIFVLFALVLQIISV